MKSVLRWTGIMALGLVIFLVAGPLALVLASVAVMAARRYEQQRRD